MMPAPGGAAQAGGRRGEDQGVSGGCRASTVLHAECLPGCPAGGGSSWKQPLPRAQILCFTLKTGKKFAEECFQVQSDE
ncbi:CUB and sushi domain-containing protein 3 [Manis javanica]|nr:CUB and sushi domain-containing protein 3 [Manis javanica]